MIDHDDFNSLTGTAKLLNPFQRRKPKKLLLLDMDETLLHAATLSDIFGQKIYGAGVVPSFVTSFKDRDQKIEIGVFIRPFMMELIQ